MQGFNTVNSKDVYNIQKKNEIDKKIMITSEAS